MAFKKTDQEWTEEAMKSLSAYATKYTWPQNINSVWSRIIKEQEIKCPKSDREIFNLVEPNLLQIEKIDYLTTVEKVQMLYVCFQPVSSAFRAILAQEGHKIWLDSTNRIQNYRFNSTAMRQKEAGRAMWLVPRVRPWPDEGEMKRSTSPLSKNRSVVTNNKRRPRTPPTKGKRAKMNEGPEEVAMSSGSNPENLKDQMSTSTGRSSEPPALDLAEFAVQVEALAETLELSELEQKASGIGKSAGSQKKLVNVDTFNISMLGIISISDIEKLPNFEGPSIKIVTFFKRLRGMLILPFGVGKLLKHIDEKIRQLENTNDTSVLSMDRIKSHLDMLLNFVS